MINEKEKFYNNFFKQNNESLRSIFKDRIKGNFLILIKSKVQEILSSDVLKYYNLSINNENFVSGNSDSYFEYDICNHIVGLHSSYSIFLSDEERIKNEKSEEYKNKLVNDVLNHIKLRRYGSVFFRNKPLSSGEQFIYYHLPYDLFVICSRMNYVLSENKKTSDFTSFYATICNKGLAVLSLLEDNFLGSAYPLCRGIIELYAKFLSLVNNPKVIHNYFTFLEYEINKECTLEYDDKFEKEYEHRLNDSATKSEYINYGWVDYIPKYTQIVKDKPYSFNGLIQYINYIINDESSSNTLNTLSTLFKMCHSYTHGTIESSKYPLLHYFEISIILYLTILHVYTIFCEEYDIDLKINDVDIIEKTNKDFSLLELQYSKRTTENFDNHYKNRK